MVIKGFPVLIEKNSIEKGIGRINHYFVKMPLTEIYHKIIT